MTSPWNIPRVRTSWLLAGAGNEGARVISTDIRYEMKRFLGWMVAVASYGVEVFRALSVPHSGEDDHIYVIYTIL